LRALKDGGKMCMYYVHTILAGRSLPLSRAPLWVALGFPWFLRNTAIRQELRWRFHGIEPRAFEPLTTLTKAHIHSPLDPSARRPTKRDMYGIALYK
jgi:hypothetical protein